VTNTDDALMPLSQIAACFEGLIPAEIATAAPDGTPNVTHLSRVHMVDDEHVALSNQFFSKTIQNLAANPRACICVVDPFTFDSYRLVLRYERTERRGPLFDRMRRDIDAIAALTGMEGVFKLRSADVYRVVELDLVRAAVHEQDATAAVTAAEATR
jgi:predicted pyridoxine 5'-phosphate oxidase superfamily flavin-nucleotide-binding protein